MDEVDASAGEEVEEEGEEAASGKNVGEEAAIVDEGEAGQISSS